MKKTLGNGIKLFLGSYLPYCIFFIMIWCSINWCYISVGMMNYKAVRLLGFVQRYLRAFVCLRGPFLKTLSEFASLGHN